MQETRTYKNKWKEKGIIWEGKVSNSPSMRMPTVMPLP